MPRKVTSQKPSLASSAVMSFPQPPARKASEYMGAYTGYPYTAISAIAQEVASLDLQLYKKVVKGNEVSTVLIHEHEVLSLLQYSNSLSTFYEMVEATQTYLELTGEAYWVLLREENTGIPQEIWLLRPDWIKIVPSKVSVVDSYIYNPGGNPGESITFPKENILPFKYFDPKNPYRGKGPIQAAAMPLDIHTFAQEWNRNFFFNSAIPSLIFTTDKRLDKRAVERFVQNWQQSYGGRAKSNKVAFLGGGFKVDTASLKAKELDFTEQQKMMRDDVLAVFKVPKSILGLTDDVNRANADATTRAFMQRVVTPRMRKFVEKLNEFLLPMYPDAQDLFFDFEDPATEDEVMKLKKFENALKYGWMTPNEVRNEEGLDPIDGGDELVNSDGPKVPRTEAEEEADGFKLFKKKKQVRVIPKLKKKQKKHMVSVPVKKLETFEREKLENDLTRDLTKMIGKMVRERSDHEVSKQAQKDSKLPSKFSDEQKDAYWLRFIEFVTDQEDTVEDLVKELFKEQEKQTLVLLDNVKYWKKDLRKGKESSVIPPIGAMNQLWKAVFIPLVRNIIILQGAYTLDFLGEPGELDMRSVAVVGYLKEHGADLITGINETTREKLRDQLAEGFANGENLDSLKNRIQSVYSEASKSRAALIARTETIRASNFATLEGYKQSGIVTAKQWLTERDDRVCPWCSEMDGTMKSLDEPFFKLGETFTAGGKTLNIERADIDHPDLHPNCRCTLIPILDGEEKIMREKKQSKEDKIIKEEVIKESLKVMVAKAQAEAEKILEGAVGKSKKEIEKAKEAATDIMMKAEKTSFEIVEAKKKDMEKISKKKIDKAKIEVKEIKSKAKSEVDVMTKEKVKEADVEAKKVVKKAETKATTIIKKAKEKRLDLLVQLKKLRDKTVKALRNGK